MVEEEITTDIINEFKDRNHIDHSTEDESLKRILTASLIYIKKRCGEFLITDDYVGRELVMERAKCTYEGNLAYFDDTYEKMIIAFGFDLQTSGDLE